MKNLLLFLILTLYIFSVFNGEVFAQQSAVLNFTPFNSDIKVGEEKIISLKITNSNKLSAFDLQFKSSPSLRITAFTNSLNTSPPLSTDKIRKVVDKTEGTSARVAYVFPTSAEALPDTVELFIHIQASTSGPANFELDTSQSQILDGNGEPLTVSPISVTTNANNSQSSNTFIDPAILPQPNYPASTAVVTVRTKLYGISTPNQRVKAVAVAVGRVGDQHFETLPSEFVLQENSDGTFSGDVAFPNFRDGTKFSLMIKADTFLQRRICNSDAGEITLGQYRCIEPSLTIRAGQKNSFDFSKMSLIPGDLGAIDGVLNGYDLNLLRSNLGKNTPEAVGQADLNRDGTLDNKDFEILRFAAANTKREADQ